MAKHSEPFPRSEVRVVKLKGKWPASAALPHSGSKLASETSFDEVLRYRRTRRPSGPTDLKILLGLIEAVFSPTSYLHEDERGRLRKAMISAGALHPIDVLVLAGPGVLGPLLFDETHSCFVELPIRDEVAFNDGLTEAMAILPESYGHLILFGGDLGRVASVYANPERLLWRDGGAAAQTFSMAAFAYGLAYCPLGLNGDALLEAIGPPDPSFVALGLSLVGQG